MHRISTVFCYIFVCLYHIHGEILYQCNFDNATLEDHCFTTSIQILTGLPILTEKPPDSPWSDVTSSLKPTNNGGVCRLPYKIDSYNWDLYFCYKKVCPTNTSANSTCASGKFAGVQLFINETKSFQLKTESDGINGINEQYLVYYYYMSNIAGKSISVRKEEVNGVNEVIDLVTSSPFNGWIKREVKYNATLRGYKLYFDVQKTSSVSSFIDIGLDEISISQDDEFTTESPTTSTLTDIISTSTLVSTLQTSQMLSTTMETSTISSTDNVEQSTITTSIFQPLTTSTVPTTVSEIKTTTSSTLSTVDITTLNTETTSIITTATTSSSETTRPTTTEVDSTYFETSSTTTTTTLAPTTITDSSSTTTMPSITSAGTTEISTDVTTLIDTNKDKPSKKTYIIILSTVIPAVVVIVSIGIAIKIKRSSSRSSSKKKLRLYIDKTYSELSTDSFELELSNPDSHF